MCPTEDAESEALVADLRRHGSSLRRSWSSTALSAVPWPLRRRRTRKFHRPSESGRIPASEVTAAGVSSALKRADTPSYSSGTLQAWERFLELTTSSYSSGGARNDPVSTNAPEGVHSTPVTTGRNDRSTMRKLPERVR